MNVVRLVVSLPYITQKTVGFAFAAIEVLREEYFDDKNLWLKLDLDYDRQHHQWSVASFSEFPMQDADLIALENKMLDTIQGFADGMSKEDIESFSDEKNIE